MTDSIRFTLDDEMIAGFAQLGAFQMFRKCSMISFLAALACAAIVSVPAWVLYFCGLGSSEAFRLTVFFVAIFVILAVAKFSNFIRRVPPKWYYESVRERITARFWRALGVVEPSSDLEGSECVVELGQDSLSFSMGSFAREFSLDNVFWVVVKRNLMVICFDDGIRTLPRGWLLPIGGPVESHFKPVVPVYIGDLDELARANFVARLKEVARHACGNSACLPGVSRCGAQRTLPSSETGEVAISAFGFDVETLVRCEKMILAANGKEPAIWEVVSALLWAALPAMGLALFAFAFTWHLERGRFVGLLGFEVVIFILFAAWLVLLMRDLTCGLGGLFPMRLGNSGRRIFMHQAVLSWLARVDTENPFLLSPLRGSLVEAPANRPPALLKWHWGVASTLVNSSWGSWLDAFDWLVVRTRARRLPRGGAPDDAPESVRFTAAFYPDRIEKGSHGMVFAESYSDVHDVVEDERYPGLAILRHENGYSQLVVRTDLLGPGEWDEVKARIARSRVKRRRCSVWESDTGTIAVGPDGAGD